MADTPPLPTGRARGRARGRGRTSEEALAALRKPGDVPPQAAGVGPASTATGRGRGVSGEREAVARGRGVSQEREGGPAVPSSGRAYHRGSVTGGPVGSDTISSALSSTHLGSGGSNSGGMGDSGNGNGASGASVGRGATRGRRDRARPSEIASEGQPPG